MCDRRLFTIIFTKFSLSMSNFSYNFEYIFDWCKQSCWSQLASTYLITDENEFKDA